MIGCLHGVLCWEVLTPDTGYNGDQAIYRGDTQHFRLNYAIVIELETNLREV